MASFMNGFSATITDEMGTPCFLASLYHEMDNEMLKHQSLIELVKQILNKAGISFHGKEAQRCLLELFTSLFIRQQNDANLDITAQEFFTLISDDELNWMPYLYNVISCLTLATANRFLVQLLSYLTDSSQRISDLKLVILGLTLVETILLDLLNVQQSLRPATNSPAGDTLSRKSQIFHKDALQLSLLYCELLQTFVKWDQCEEILSLVRNENSLLDAVIPKIYLALIILDPSCSENDLEQLLQSLYLGKNVLVQQSTVKVKKSKSKKKEMSGVIACSLTEVTHVNTSPLNTESNTSFSVAEEFPNSKTLTPLLYLINCLKIGATDHLVSSLIRLLCLLEQDPNTLFRFLGKTITIGNHAVDGQLLTTCVLYMVKVWFEGSSNKSLASSPDYMSACLKETLFRVPGQYFDPNSLLTSEAELFLQSGRQFSGQDDLDWLKKMVSNKDPLWKDLLTVGLRNMDVLNWWNIGIFYELVSQNYVFLLTLENVQQLLKVHCQAIIHYRDLEMSTKLKQLFKKAFFGLSTPLQEQITLSVINNTDICTGDMLQFQQQMSEEDVLSELTPLFNKLTDANVDELKSTMLYLCMYQPNAVIRQAIVTAFEHTAQVGVIVRVLRKFPNVCQSCQLHVKYSRLIASCLDVLNSTKINENIMKNTAQIFTQFMKSYTNALDSESNILMKYGGLMRPNDIMNHFVLPHLTADISTSDDTEPRGSLALNILHSLLANTDKYIAVTLDPFPLLAALIRMYSDNYYIYHNKQLSQRKLTLKQSSQLCLEHLTQVVAKYSKSFSESDFYWLKNYSLSSGWLHVALLKPVLDHCCDLELQSLIVFLMSRTSLTSEDNLKLLVLLSRLAVVNDGMFMEVQHFVQHAKLTTSLPVMLVLIQQMLLMSLPTEIHRLVKILVVLGDSQVFPISPVLHKQDLDILISVGSLLTKAVILCLNTVTCQLARCHVAGQYSAAIQALVPPDTQDVHFLTELIAYHCQLLYKADDQTAQMIQMSVLDLIMKLTRLQSDPTNVLTETQLNNLLDLACCVNEESAKNILMTQLQEITC